MNRTSMLLALMLILEGCETPPPSIDLQGHRGCRGILPENTIEGFLKALEIGVTTLEMDVAISKDKKVVVTHEPYFSHEIATSPTGQKITKEEELSHNIYQLPYQEIKQYDVGMRPLGRFPNQKKIPAFKPLLSQVIEEAEQYTQEKKLKKPYYNIEIKRDPKYDDLYHPNAEEFVKLVLQQVNDWDIADRVCLQSFDIETLQQINKVAPDLTIALLVDLEATFEESIKKLGFSPRVYSPYFMLVNQDLMNTCRAKNIQVIPWTVNEESDMLKMLALGVDGIITDYPGRLKKILVDKDIPILETKRKD